MFDPSDVALLAVATWGQSPTNSTRTRRRRRQRLGLLQNHQVNSQNANILIEST